MVAVAFGGVGIVVVGVVVVIVMIGCVEVVVTWQGDGGGSCVWRCRDSGGGHVWTCQDGGHHCKGGGHGDGEGILANTVMSLTA